MTLELKQYKILQKLTAENVQLKTLIKLIVMAGFVDFIERRNLRNDTTGSN